MRIGLINQLQGTPGPDQPTWRSLQSRIAAAEDVGFDSFVFEDALLYRGETETSGCWESVSIAAALAAVTSRITIGQSVINNPYRSPALTAKIAETIDEISGGRYTLGIGAGNTADSDYAAFGFPTDKRYSRFAEAIEIIYSLLKTGKASFSGDYYTIDDAGMVIRGPRPQGPPINIAAGGPKMLNLVARYADAWNWWGGDETHEQTIKRLTPIVEMLEAACENADRDPATLERTFDLYAVVAPGFASDGGGFSEPITGTSEEIADRILRLEEIGIEEVRCDVFPNAVEAIDSMRSVVDLVHTE